MDEGKILQFLNRSIKLQQLLIRLILLQLPSTMNSSIVLLYNSAEGTKTEVALQNKNVILTLPQTLVACLQFAVTFQLFEREQTDVSKLPKETM